MLRKFKKIKQKEVNQMAKFVLTDRKASLNPNSKELSTLLLDRMGIGPRKAGATDRIPNVLLELYEASKRANQNKKPEDAIMTVEESAAIAGITRQTMYDYIKRWISLNIITKASYIKNQEVIRGYKLNGQTLESAFQKAKQVIENNIEQTLDYVKELQRIIKNEKIKDKMKK